MHSSSKSSLLNDLENSLTVNRSSNNDRNVDYFEMDDVSPPASPIIKGVVEKSDSVSYVLEIDDEAPEKVASRVVRRVGSFRSSFNEKHMPHSPIPKRQKCQLNPLATSASATAILRQASEISPSKTLVSPMLSHRTRSKSVCVKDSIQPTNDVKKIVRSNSSNSEATVMTPAQKSKHDIWQDQPMCASSPYERNSLISEETIAATSETSLTSLSTPDHHRYQDNGQDHDHDDDNDYDAETYNTTSYRPKRITCDTAALTTERDELCPSLPSHPSMQDIKKIQNFHPKESAGEAMVSGSNSEDDASSLCGGGSTPMEVSWSEDGDHYPSESIV